MLPKVSARLTFSRILVLWGITSACMLFVQNVTAFYAMRFLLGVFEAGFAPGMIYYLSCWYGPARMARAIVLVFVAGPPGGIVGGPTSAWLMTTLSGVWGLADWQWMFLVEGLPCVALGLREEVHGQVPAPETSRAASGTTCRRRRPRLLPMRSST